MGLVIDKLREHQQVNLIKIYENEYSKNEFTSGVFRGRTVREVIRDMSEVGRAELEARLANRPSPLVPSINVLWGDLLEYFKNMEIHEDDVRFKSQKQGSYLKAYRQHSQDVAVSAMFYGQARM